MKVGLLDSVGHPLTDNSLRVEQQRMQLPALSPASIAGSVMYNKNRREKEVETIAMMMEETKRY
jgi:hypothetical protein